MLKFKYSSDLFSKRIKNYKNYCDIVKPDAVCIDYEVNPLDIVKYKDTIQGYGPKSIINR